MIRRIIEKIASCTTGSDSMQNEALKFTPYSIYDVYYLLIPTKRRGLTR